MLSCISTPDGPFTQDEATDSTSVPKSAKAKLIG